jgi:hypothetical protein
MSISETCIHIKQPIHPNDDYKYCGLKEGFFECGFEERWGKCPLFVSIFDKKV